MYPDYYCILSLIITAIILIITAFISFSFLSARRILCTIISFSLYGGDPYYLLFLLYGGDPYYFLFLLYGGDPYYFLFLSFYILRHLQWSVRRTFGCEQTHNFCLIKVYCYLAGKFDNILFNWAIINFFLIEYYVRAYWISYV